MVDAFCMQQVYLVRVYLLHSWISTLETKPCSPCAGGCVQTPPLVTVMHQQAQTPSHPVMNIPSLFRLLDVRMQLWFADAEQSYAGH